MCIVFTAAVIIIVTILETPTWLQDIAKGNLRFGIVENETEEALNMTLNANALAYYSITGICCILMLFKVSSYNRIILIAQMIFLILTGFITLSRTWAFVAALLLVLYILAASTSVKSACKSFLSLAILAVVVVLILKKYPQLYQGMVERFEDKSFETGSGRFEITRNYLKLFDNNLRTMLFGTGVTVYRSFLGLTNSMHNSLVQILICYGIVGGLIFMVGWLADVVKKIGKVRLFYWIPFICVFVFSLSLQIVNPYNLIFSHLAAIFVLNMGLQEAQKKLLNNSEQKI